MLIHEGVSYLQSIWKGVTLKDNASFEGNPFLLGYEGYQLSNELLVKIRACEMLLLEEQL